MKKYYYLDGSNKKGPFSENEFIQLDIDSNTLIWIEGQDSWKPLKEFPDILKTIPPKAPEKIVSMSKKERNNRKLLYFISLLVFLLVVSYSVSYYMIEEKKDKLRRELNDKIDVFFDGKQFVFDGVNYQAEGELKNVNEELRYIRENKIISFKKYFYNNEAKKMGLIDIFYLKKGGFILNKLKKIHGGLEIEVIKSTNMAFTSKYWGRGSVQSAYSQAYSYFLEENESCFLKGAYPLRVKMLDFRNEYYVYYPIDDNFYSGPDYDFSSDHDLSPEFEYNISTLYYKVFYKKELHEYGIFVDDSRIKYDFITLLKYTMGFSFILFLVIFLLNPFKW